jgi:hypothetical protein
MLFSGIRVSSGSSCSAFKRGEVPPSDARISGASNNDHNRRQARSWVGSGDTLTLILVGRLSLPILKRLDIRNAEANSAP